jgi:hypothetical protein
VGTGLLAGKWRGRKAVSSSSEEEGPVPEGLGRRLNSGARQDRGVRGERGERGMQGSRVQGMLQADRAKTKYARCIPDFWYAQVFFEG